MGRQDRERRFRRAQPARRRHPPGSSCTYRLARTTQAVQTSPRSWASSWSKRCPSLPPGAVRSTQRGAHPEARHRQGPRASTPLVVGSCGKAGGERVQCRRARAKRYAPVFNCKIVRTVHSFRLAIKCTSVHLCRTR